MRNSFGEIVVPEVDFAAEAEACMMLLEPLLPHDPEAYGFAYRVDRFVGYYGDNKFYLVLFRPNMSEPPTPRWWRKKYTGPEIVLAREEINWDPDDPGSVPKGLEDAAARIIVRQTMKALPKVETE